MASKDRKPKAKDRLQGTLHVVATPIGNLGDVSDRCREVLAGCDVVAAEDTRVARRLLAACGIKAKPLVSVREHNERGAAEQLGKKHAGQSIAYLSDAGTPALSDPGSVLCATLAGMGFAVVPVPGPSAVATAVSVSGLGGDGFVFAGFLPRKKKDFVARLAQCCSPGLPVVVFESPARVQSTLAWMGEALGSRTQVCMCRELTKVHEQVLVDTPENLLATLGDGQERPKGEFTLVVQAQSTDQFPAANAMEMLREIAREVPPARAAKIVARLTGEDAKRLYGLLAKEREIGDG